jgi:hypothetical protein
MFLNILGFSFSYKIHASSLSSYLVLAAGFYFAPHNMPDTIESLRHFTPAPELNLTVSTLWRSTKMLTSSLLMQPKV